MSTEAAASTETVETESQEDQTDQQPEVFDAEYVAKLRRESAKYRNDAKANAAAAKKLAELEDAQKSDAEKAADRIAKAEADVAAVPEKVAEALKAHLVELHSIDAEDADLLLNAKDPETLLKQVSRLLGSTSDKRRTKSNSVPREGRNPTAAPSDDAAFASGLLGG